MAGVCKSRVASIAALLLLTGALGACAQSEETGFTLPNGNAADGRAAFIRLGCASCHDVIGVKGLLASDQVPQMTIPLGGVRERAYSYDELVTSIINPSHRLSDAYGVATSDEQGRSRMPVLNDVMSVTELVDIVTFLEEHYQLAPYASTEYPSHR